VTTGGGVNKVGCRTGAVGRTNSEVVQQNSGPAMIFLCNIHQ
jgi:hypothetical protein